MNNRYVIPANPNNPYGTGRHVNHDPRSLAYLFRAPASITYKAVKWQRNVPIFDQGQLGSCTGNAMIGCLATGGFYDTLQGRSLAYSFDEDGAVKCYEDATKIDPYQGTYPPTDTGSDGNSVALVAKTAGMISGFRHAITFDDAMAALQVGPVIFGLDWYEDMFYPDETDQLHVTGSLAGGHEIVLDEYNPDSGEVGLTNSWSESWGAGGRAYLKIADFKKLQSRDGDVTVPTPITAPAPVPTPPAPGVVTAADAAAAVRKTLTDLGL